MTNTFKHFFSAIAATLMFSITLTTYAADTAPAKQLEEATDSFIISVTSSQPIPIEGSYLIMSSDNSKFVVLNNQSAPFELQVPADNVNAVFHVSGNSTDEIKVDLYLVPKSDPNKKKLLTSGTGRSVIVSNSISKRKKNVYSIIGGP